MSDANQEQELTVEGETTQADAQPETNPEEVVEPQTQSEEPSLPDGAKERTKEEFEKLKAKNKELAEKLAALEPQAEVERPSFFNAPLPTITPAQYQGVSQQEIDQKVQSLVDENGYLDVERLKVELRQASEAKKIAEEARQESLRTRQEVEKINHTREVAETYKEYPELDPENESFDPKFYDMVSNQIYGQIMKGKKQDFLSAAKHVATSLYDPKALKAQEATAKQQVREESKVNRVAATTSVGQGKGQPLPVNHEELVDQSRKGSMDAIYKRLQASGN